MLLENKCKGMWLVLAFLIVAPISVLGQEEPPRENGRKLEGSWSIVVTTRDCTTGAAGRTFPAMFTFMRGGTMVEFATGALTSGQPNLGIRTTSQGIWSYESNGNYSSASQFFRVAADFTLQGSARRDDQIVLSDDGESFTSTGTEKFYSTAGVLLQTRCNTQAATRFK